MFMTRCSTSEKVVVDDEDGPVRTRTARSVGDDAGVEDEAGAAARGVNPNEKPPPPISSSSSIIFVGRGTEKKEE